MNGYTFYSAGHTAALQHTVTALKRKGCTFANVPTSKVTHLLLDVPNHSDCNDILPLLPDTVTVIGGNLKPEDFHNREIIDLLKDPYYLAQNANITAHCAVKLAMGHLPVTLQNCPVLVVGWGRIGKCLAALLKQMGAIVSVAARKESDRAILTALGYDTEDLSQNTYALVRYRVIFNTVPTMVLPEESLQYCQEDCLKIDLASAPGMAGDDIIIAKGLPSKLAPESSGELIGKAVLRQIVTNKKE